MYKKKLLVLSLAAALFPLSLSLSAAEEEGESAAAAPAVQNADSMPADDAAATPSEAAGDSETSSAPERPSSMDEMEARWKSRNEHYEDLRKRAESMGVILPEKPPWSSPDAMGMMRPGMEERMQQHQRMMSMTPEEREAARAAHYQEMRERAKEAGVDLPETPPWEQRAERLKDEWARQQAVIDGMSDEERAACQAMHRRQMGMMWDNQERPMMGRPGMGPGAGMGPGMGRGMGPGMMGPGYGYGPDPYYGQQNFWNPNQ